MFDHNPQVATPNDPPSHAALSPAAQARWQALCATIGEFAKLGYQIINTVAPSGQQVLVANLYGLVVAEQAVAGPSDYVPAVDRLVQDCIDIQRGRQAGRRAA